jgi:hypothetical protein
VTGAQKLLLLDLCEPGSEKTSAVSDSDIQPLLVAAKAHGVLPVVVRRLSQFANVRENADFLRAKYDVEIVTGQSMLLSHFGGQVSAAFKSAGVRFTIVKGPTFATHLYQNRTDRPFTDVDFLVHVDDIDQANNAMRSLGLVMNGFADRPAEVYGEYKWEPPDGRNVLIELHTNLVHSPKLREGVSLSYETLQRAGDGVPEAPAALMLVAGMHASFSHQFERLQLLVDVLQAARNVTRQGAISQTVRACREIGADLAVSTALDLAARAFAAPEARTLADAISANRYRHVASLLVSPALAAGAQDASAWKGSWRRKMYRQLLLRASAVDGTA